MITFFKRIWAVYERFFDEYPAALLWTARF